MPFSIEGKLFGRESMIMSIVDRDSTAVPSTTSSTATPVGGTGKVGYGWSWCEWVAFLDWFWEERIAEEVTTEPPREWPTRINDATEFGSFKSI